MDIQLDRDEIDETLFQALRAIYQFERDKVRTFGLTFEEIYLLQFLRRRSPLRVSELADEMKIPISTLSRSIGRLQKRGLVTRRQDPQDKRIMLVSLLSKGEKTVLDVEEHSFEMIMKNLAEFKAQDIAAFVQTARQLNTILSPGDNDKQKEDA